MSVEYKSYKLPIEVERFIQKYFQLNINSVAVRTPYYMNDFFSFNSNSVLVGKGDPQTIEEYVNRNIPSHLRSEDQIRKWMIDRNIGVDCSGLVLNIYQYWLKIKNLDISDYLPRVSLLNVKKFLSRKFRVQNSVNANELTSPPFSTQVRLIEVLPGDLIRTKGGGHVLFVTKVVKSSFFVKELHFVNSAREYETNGVRDGIIEFNFKQNLKSANWIDFPQEKENYALKGYKEKINRNGLFRPNLPIFNDVLVD